MNDITWKPMRTAPKNKKIILLGSTDLEIPEYLEIEGKYYKDVEGFCSDGGWVIGAVAWRESDD